MSRNVVEDIANVELRPTFVGLVDDTGMGQDVIDKLAKYAVQGVEFTYLRVADITMNNELVDGQRQVGVLYGFDGADTVLSAIARNRLRRPRTRMQGGTAKFPSSLSGTEDFLFCLPCRQI